MKKFWLLSLILILSLGLFAERKALLIGNATYDGMTLASPINDINAMEAALGNWGFSVSKAQNLNLAQMNRTINTFISSIEAEDEVFFYYSGHGVFGGANYLVPAGINLQNRQTFSQTAYPLAQLIPRLSVAKAAVLMLEASRNWITSSGSTPKPFATITTTDSLVSVLSAAQASTCVNSANPPHSAFTQAFIAKFNQSTESYNTTIQALQTELRAVPSRPIDPWISPRPLKNDFLMNLQNQRFFFKGGAMDMEGGGSLSW